MIGVILWSDSTDQKAVIWCEDQGDLAFLSSPDCIHLPDTFFEVGDLVEFDVSTRKNLRLAHNTSRLGETTGTVLSDDLRQAASTLPTHDTTAKIVPFRPGIPRTGPHGPLPFQRRQG